MLVEPFTTSSVIVELGIILVKVALASPLSGKSKLDYRNGRIYVKMLYIYIPVYNSYT